VADRHHGAEVEEAGAALDGVETAEHRVQAFAVGGRALERDHLLAELVEELADLDQEVGADIGSGARHRATAPATTAGCWRRPGSPQARPGPGSTDRGRGWTAAADDRCPARTRPGPRRRCAPARPRGG